MIWKNVTNPENITLPLTPTPTTTVANRDERSHIFQTPTPLLLLTLRLLLRLRKLFKHQLPLLFTFRKPQSNSYQTYSVCFTSRSKIDITYQMYVCKSTPALWLRDHLCRRKIFDQPKLLNGSGKRPHVNIPGSTRKPVIEWEWHTFTFEKTYLHIWNIWENSVYVHLSYWFFGKIQRKSKTTFSVSHLAFPIRFLRFADRRKNQKQDPFKNVVSGRFGREIRRSKRVS